MVAVAASADADHECYRVMLIGDGAVGKSSIMLRYCENKFDARHMMTIGVDFKTKILQLDSDKVRLQIWDTAGQERFRNITPVYFRSSNGIVLVYDVTNVESFENVTYWLASLESHGSSDKPKVLVGNKVDLARRKISKRRGEALAAKHQIAHFETSALEDIGISTMFNTLAKQIRAKHRNTPHATPRAPSAAPFQLAETPLPDERGGLDCCARVWKAAEPYWPAERRSAELSVPPAPTGSGEPTIAPPALSGSARTRFGRISTSGRVVSGVLSKPTPISKRRTGEVPDEEAS